MVQVIVVLLFFILAAYLNHQFAPPDWQKIINIVLVVLFVLFLINLLLSLTAYGPMVGWPALR